MTKQQYIDLLISTSASGGFPSVDGAQCLYRAPGGKKCAVGLLIPDDRYCAPLEHCGAHSYLVQEALIGHIPDGVTHEHLLILQGLHDSMGRSGVWAHDKFVSGVHEILD